MRRNAAVLALFVLVAPLAARLVASSVDAEAARCALACARAAMGGEKGAVCCPTGHGAAGPTLSSCPHEGDAAPLPAAAGLALLAAALLLPMPSTTRRRAWVPVLAFPFPASRIPDKVPLLLG